MKNKKHIIIASILVIVSLLFFIVLALHYNKIDQKYEECMEQQAKEKCARQEKEMAYYSAWQPQVKCRKIESTSNFFVINPNIELNTGEVYIFNESEIQKCWQIAKN